MDEEDFINDLGWNGMSSCPVEESVVSKDEAAVSESGTQAIASTSHTQGNITTELSKPDMTVKSTRGRPPKSAYTNMKPTRVGALNKHF